MTWVILVLCLILGPMFAAVVVGYLVAGFISTWWEGRKRDKGKRG